MSDEGNPFETPVRTEPVFVYVEWKQFAATPEYQRGIQVRAGFFKYHSEAKEFIKKQLLDKRVTRIRVFQGKDMSGAFMDLPESYSQGVLEPEMIIDAEPSFMEELEALESESEDN